MRTPVEQLPVDGAQIFRPLLFQMDQRPLSAAEGEVLDTGNGQIGIFPGVGHTISVQVTPSGSASSSMETV